MASKAKNLKKMHNYENNQNQFCYIYTEYEIPKYWKNTAGKIRDMYAKYFTNV